MSPQSEDLALLRDELQQIIADGSEVWTRQAQARNVRFNTWEGQSRDGRRHRAALGEEPRPFEGSSDARIPLVDDFVNEKVRLAKQGFFRADVQAIPVEPEDASSAQQATSLLRWLRDSAMREELEAEVELSAQYLYGDDPGLAIVEVKWWQDAMLQPRTLNADELAALYATGAANPDAVDPGDERLTPAILMDFADLVVNPLRRDELVGWLARAFPGASARALKAAAKDLERDGTAELAVPVIRENRPCVETLRLFDEFFFPIGTADLQRARNVHRREWLNEVELRERVLTMAWSSAVVEEIIAKAQGYTIADDLASSGLLSPVALSGSGRHANEHDHLFEIWWSYERRSDERGVPGVWCFVWSAALRAAPLKTELLRHASGKYPFVVRGRERLGRQITESRGLSRAIETHQTEVKVQRDARSDHTQIATLPPMKVRLQRGASELIMGPGAQIPVQRMDDFEWLQPPQAPVASIEMERTTKQEAAEYCGRALPGEDPSRAAVIVQDEIDNFFGLWRAAFRMVLQLCQQYYTPAELARVTGADGLAAQMTPEDIRGAWDIALAIDARDLNMEFAVKKLKAFADLVPLDAAGVIDRAPLVEWAARSFDPVLARRALRPQENATQKEIEATKSALTQMAAGIEPDMPVQGINAQLRMQTLMSTMQSSPKLQQQFMGDALFQQLVTNYQKYLTQQLAQEQNKLVGRLGTAPVQGTPQSAAA